VDISGLERYLNNQFNSLYGFAYILVPDELQASQICIDSISSFLLECKDLVSDFLDDKSVNQEIKIKLYQFVYNLSVKRDVQLTTLSTENRNSSFFYQLDINKRGIIYLRDRSQLLLSEIELIVGRRNYEIINDYELAKNLVQLKEQRPL
jgi:hypothetical protein